MELKELDCKVSSITTEEYPTKAARPKYSVLSTKDIENDFGVEVPEWENSLKECLEKIS